MEKTIEIPEGYEARIEGNKVILERKESEDEKTRKGLIWHLEELRAWKVGTLSPIRLSADYDVWIAYLERQKERGPLSKNEEYTLARIIEYLEDNDCPSEWKDLLHDVYSLPYQKEQQPAEWSKEDEKMLADIVFAIREVWQEKDANRMIAKLKSLRPQPKVEWSEEDKMHFNNAILAAQKKWGAESCTAKFLKSPCPRWKPSKEQPEVDLENFISDFFDKKDAENNGRWSEDDIVEAITKAYELGRARKEESVSIAESPSKTFPRVNEFDCGSSYRH